MSTGKSTAGTRVRCTSAARIGLLLGVNTFLTPAAGADFADVLAARAPLAGYFRDARGAATRVTEQARALNAQHGLVAPPGPGVGAAAAPPLSDFPARLHHAFGSGLVLPSEAALQDDREALLRNSDAFVRAAVRVTLGKERRGFVYVDMGAADSALKWQGLAGIHSGRDVDLLGGWRHVTYHFSPGRGFDSIDFNGPFLGATLAW
ncbi:MAG TPA: hypothetical protein VI653_02415 [Steroidobacteraceae bacterium]